MHAWAGGPKCTGARGGDGVMKILHFLGTKYMDGPLVTIVYKTICKVNKIDQKNLPV